MRTDPGVALKQLSGFMATLNGVDDYGIPPLSVYQRFNSVGSDHHGQCAIAQGARGYSASLAAGFDLGKLFMPHSPISLKAGADLSGIRMPTSAVLLFRLPAAVTARGASKLPIGLARIDGVTWTGTGNVNLKAGIGHDLFSFLFTAGASATAKLEAVVTTTRLTTNRTQHFGDSARAELADAVDELLAVEIKKTCVAILTANTGWLTRDLPETAPEAGAALATAANKASRDIRSAESSGGVSSPPSKDSGWFYVIAGAVLKGVAFLAQPAAQDALTNFLKRSDDDVLEQMRTLREQLEERLRALHGREGTGSDEQREQEAVERAQLTEALMRLTAFRDALFRQRFSKDQVFTNRSPADAPAVPAVDETSVERADDTSLTLTSYNWEIRGDLDAHATTVTAAKLHGDAGVRGRTVTFRFRVRGANDVVLVQDTYANYFQMTANAAFNARLVHTGVDAADKKLLADLQKERKKTGSSSGPRRFGALTYRAANVYYHTRSGTVLPLVSGVSLGVSVRVNPLCDYADAIRGGAPLAEQLRSFETWICNQVACTPADLRSFVVDAPLGADYKHADEKVGGNPVGYPVDALLLEAGYGSNPKRGSRLAELKSGEVEPVDLFGYHGFSDTPSWKHEVDAGTRALTVMRLRYRIRSPLSSTAKRSMPIGLPKDLLPFELNFKFGRDTEVGQEGIADLHTRFSDEVESSQADEHTKYEMNLPPVVLFNRG